MRTARAATAIALGLLVGLTTVAMPALAGCSSLVGNPSGCATAMYYNAKENGGEAAAGATSYAGAAPASLAACSPAAVPVPAVAWDPAPAVGSNVAYAEAQRAAVAAWRSAPASQLFPATGALGTALWGNTRDVFERWDEHVFTPLTTAAVGLVVEPEVPDPGPWVEDSGLLLGAAADGAACAQDQPMPAL